MKNEENIKAYRFGIIVPIFIFFAIALASKCTGNRSVLQREIGENREKLEGYREQAREIENQLVSARGFAEELDVKIEQARNEFDTIREQIQSGDGESKYREMDIFGNRVCSWGMCNLFSSENNKIKGEKMNFVVFLITWLRTYLIGVSEYAGSILIMSLIFYILVWGLKKAMPEFWSVKLYEKNTIKVEKTEDGKEQIIKAKSEKKMNTLIPLFVSLAGFLCFLAITKLNISASAVAGGAVSLLASTIDNMLSILVNTTSTVFELIRRFVRKIGAKNKNALAKDTTEDETRMKKLEDKFDTLLNALNGYNKPTSNDTEQSAV